MASTMCECSDRGCKVHAGEPDCTATSDVVLYRIDMVDASGTAFCEDCADDASESGLFGSEPNSYSR